MYRQLEKNLLNSITSSTCPGNMVNFGLLTAEIRWRVWGTPANFNGFRVLAALLHSTLVVGVSQTLRRWTEGATYIRQGGHHVGHWPTFWFNFFQLSQKSCIDLKLNGLECGPMSGPASRKPCGRKGPPRLRCLKLSCWQNQLPFVNLSFVQSFSDLVRRAVK